MVSLAENLVAGFCINYDLRPIFTAINAPFFEKIILLNKIKDRDRSKIAVCPDLLLINFYAQFS
jgi:hypothetical protein